MRYIVDIPPEVVDIIQKQIEKGGYRTIQEFILTSIQNQVYIIENPLEPIQQESVTYKPPESEHDNKKNLTNLDDFNFDTVEPDNSKLYTTLSGFWNKFFPVKITVRVLANLMEEQDGPILLDSLQEIASREARKIGLALKRSEKGSGRKRGDRLFTGLPVSKNSESSRSRFKSHFVGDLREDKIDGMPATLRLLDIFTGSDGNDYARLTNIGLEFCKFENPYLDLNNKNSVLSEEEQEFLVHVIKQYLPDEMQDIRFILNSIGKGENNTGVLKNTIKGSKPDFSENQVATYLAGHLNRMNDLKLVNRKYDGLSYIYVVSEKCNELVGGLRK